MIRLETSPVGKLAGCESMSNDGTQSTAVQPLQPWPAVEPASSRRQHKPPRVGIYNNISVETIHFLLLLLPRWTPTPLLVWCCRAGRHHYKAMHTTVTNTRLSGSTRPCIHAQHKSQAQLRPLQPATAHLTACPSRHPCATQHTQTTAAQPMGEWAKDWGAGHEAAGCDSMPRPGEHDYA